MNLTLRENKISLGNVKSYTEERQLDGGDQISGRTEGKFSTGQLMGIEVRNQFD